MKIKTIITSFVIAAAAVCFASRSFAAPQYSWAQSYGVDSYGLDGKLTDDPFYGSGHDLPVAMAKMPDGGFVVAGQIDLPELYRTNAFHTSAYAMGALVRYAADGSILWQTELRQNNDKTEGGIYYPAVSHIHQVATDAAGNVFVAGGKGNTSNGGEQPFVAKFSAGGALLWDNGFNGGSAVVGTPPQTVPLGVGTIYYMSLTNDGGVVVTLAQSRPNQAYSIPALAKFNADGSFAFSKSYENSIQYLLSTPVCQSKDGSRYIMAFLYATDGSALGDRYGIYLLVTDAAGNIVAQRGYNHSDSPNETPIAIVATADGGFATLSVPYSDGNFGILRKFNADLSSELFEKRIAITPGQARGFLATNSLIETSDGGFLIGGATQDQNGSNPFDMMLMKLNSSGALQFVSILGGLKNDGGPINTGPASSFAIETSDGGYGLAATSASFHTGGSIGGGSYDKPDWWMAKTDANRKVRGFKDIMLDQPLGTFTLSGSPAAAANLSAFSAPTYPYGLSIATQPQFILDDLNKKAAPNRPVVIFQASSPRILGPRAAEAVIGQHFSYHILAGFFDSTSVLTYSATGLPPNFVIDPKTGIISGVAQPGTETTTPIAIALQVSDGTDTATATLRLTIGEGTPVLTVNGSSQPAANLNDKPLAFAAVYPGSGAGRLLSVQSSADPNNAASWTNLPTGTAGYMTPDPFGGRYVLNTTNYPQQNGLSFRVRVTTPSRADIFSNAVGPFSLASGQSRAGQTLFRVVRNGLRADLDFRATQISPATGVALRVQSTSTPGEESSWTDLSNSQGNASAMTAIDSTHFALAKNSASTGDGIYFRAVGSASGFVDSLSNVIGPFTLAAISPPKVSITSPSGGTSASNPAVVRQGADGSYQYQVNVTPTKGDRAIATLSIAFDGEIISSFSSVISGQLYTAARSTTLLGDHVVEAIAIDDLGVIGRAGSGPQYLRILPPAASASAKNIYGGVQAAAAFRAEVYTVAISGGDWNTPATWRDSQGNPGVPTSSDFVIIGDATVKNVAGGVYAMTVSGGHLSGGSLQVNNMLTISNGTFDGLFNLFIKPGAVCELLNPSDVIVDGVLQNQGTINVHGARGLTGVSNFLNVGKITFQPVLLPSEQVALALPLNPRAITAADFNLSGKIGQSFIGPNGTPLISPNGAALIAPNGAALVGNSGGTLITNDGGSLITNDGGSLITNDGGSLITNDGGSIISNDGASLLSENGLGLSGNSPAALIAKNVAANNSSSNVRAATQAGGIAINGGEVDLTGISLSGALTLNSGVLSGSGVIYGSLSNSGGYISPGHSAGQITVTGNFTQGSNGTLVIEAAGGEAGQFDRLQIGGSASLGGKLDLRLTNGFVPLIGEKFNPLGYSSASGTFASVSSNAQINVNGTGLSAIIDPAKPNPRPGQPLNIATRLQILGGDNGLIEGFIITGTPGSTKKVLIRGLGPSTGVAGAISDPILQLKGDGGVDIVNDDWQQGDTSQIPTGFSPSNPKESVIVATLTIGSAGSSNFTAILRDVKGQVGIGLAEVYDLDSAGVPQLANIATRGLVQTGDNVMIGGFIIGGTEPAKVLVRVTGPTLTKLGIAGALADPTLELHDGNGGVISNDDWRATQESEITTTTIPPADDKEPAILATLVPGNYTAVVRGANDTTGVAVVEAYNLQ